MSVEMPLHSGPPGWDGGETPLPVEGGDVTGSCATAIATAKVDAAISTGSNSTRVVPCSKIVNVEVCPS